MGLALPSPEDVATAIDVALQQQSLDSASSVKNFVVSPFGTIEFEPTPVGRKLMFYEHNNPLGSIERALIVTDAIVRAPHSVERMAAKSPMLTTSEIIAELCAQMTDDNFLMTIDHVQSCHQTFCLSRGAQAR